jgi:hypothetical protein
MDGVADERFVVHDQYVFLLANAFVHHGHKSAISVPVLFLPPGLGVSHRFWACCCVPFLENNVLQSADCADAADFICRKKAQKAQKRSACGILFYMFFAFFAVAPDVL